MKLRYVRNTVKNNNYVKEEMPTEEMRLQYRARHTLIAFSVLYSRLVPDTVRVLSQVISDVMLRSLRVLERRLARKIPVELVNCNTNNKIRTKVLM